MRFRDVMFCVGVVAAVIACGVWGVHRGEEWRLRDVQACFDAAPWDQEYRWVWCSENRFTWKRLDKEWNG